MADVMLKVRPGAGYEDQDILCAFTDHRIACCHQQHICFAKDSNRRLIGLNRDGLLPNTHVAKDWYEHASIYRFERLSRNEGRVTRLADGAQIRFRSGEVFTGFGGGNECMHIAEFVRGRIERGKACLFGLKGREIWYGGAGRNVQVAPIWTAIENKTARNRNEPQLQVWPAGRQDLKSHLLIKTDDFDAAAADEMTEVEFADADKAVITRKRKRFIPWRDELGLTGREIDDIDNRSKAVEAREVKRNRVVRTKA